MKENYIKSPLNYVGGKYKLLNDIIPLFPDKISTFVDFFGGGGVQRWNKCKSRTLYI